MVLYKSVPVDVASMAANSVLFVLSSLAIFTSVTGLLTLQYFTLKSLEALSVKI